jgi:hypothetical protein
LPDATRFTTATELQQSCTRAAPEHATAALIVFPEQVADLPDTDVRMKDTDARMKDTDVRMKDADARKGPVASLSYDKLSYDKLSALEPRGGVTLELSDGTRCLLYYCLSYCCFTALLLYCGFTTCNRGGSR